MTAVVYDNWYAGWNSCPTDSGDKRFRVYSAPADADSFRLGPPTAYVADIDIVYARGDIKPGLKPYSVVVAAGCVEFQRLNTHSRVVDAARIARERQPTIGGEIVAGGIA